MIDSDHPSLSIARQCQLLSISRSGFYYRPLGESELNLTLMRLIDEQHMRRPYYGAQDVAFSSTARDRHLWNGSSHHHQLRCTRIPRPCLPRRENLLSGPIHYATVCMRPPGMGMVIYDKARTCLRLVGVKRA